MKKFLFPLLTLFFVSCAETNSNPKYEANLALAKKWFQTFETENMEELSKYFADKLQYQGAFYGQPMMNSKEEVINYMKGWHDSMENIKYTPENFLPGVDNNTNLPDGSVRTYGTWTGVNTISGKSFEVKFYHYMNFDDNGLMIEGGDYGDATGIMLAVAPDE